MAHPHKRMSNSELRIEKEKAVHDSKFTSPNSKFRPRELGPRARDAGRWGMMKPLKLREIMKLHAITAQDMADCIFNSKGMALARPTIYQVSNRGILPTTSTPDFKIQAEAYLTDHGVPPAQIARVWDEAGDADVIPLHALPADHGDRVREGMRKKAGHKTSDKFAETIKEAEMLTPTTKKHFKIFADPFLNDVQQGADVFMSESHRYVHAAMMDAARNGGFVAACGECGAGKSIMRRKLIGELNASGDVRVVEPQTIDKNELNAGHILDAIILDLDPNAVPKRTREAKARQVRNALLASSRAGMRHVLIIEEAHDLSISTMKQLKRLWEIEDGYRKVLGIIMVGQPELQIRLNRQTHPEMREVILRCLICTLESLNRNDCEAYLHLKFDRTRKPLHEVLADGCIDAVMARLTTRTGYPTVYPLYINNLIAKAMNAAAQIGAPLVTAEIIEGV